jgi:hypothetical protein
MVSRVFALRFCRLKQSKAGWLCGPRVVRCSCRWLLAEGNVGTGLPLAVASAPRGRETGSRFPVLFRASPPAAQLTAGASVRTQFSGARHVAARGPSPAGVQETPPQRAPHRPHVRPPARHMHVHTDFMPRLVPQVVCGGGRVISVYKITQWVSRVDGVHDDATRELWR